MWRKELMTQFYPMPLKCPAVPVRIYGFSHHKSTARAVREVQWEHHAEITVPTLPTHLTYADGHWLSRSPRAGI